MNDKKVLVICQHFWPENFRITDICEGLSENGIQVEVLCGIPNYPKGKFYNGYSAFKNRKQQYKEINIRRVLEIPRGGNSNIRILINYLSFPFFSLFHLPKLLFKKYDKIFLYQLSPVMMSLVGILLGKIKKTETILYVLDLWPENLFSVLKVKNPLLVKLVTSISNWHYKKADKLAAVSQGMRDLLINRFQKDPEKVLYLPQFCEQLYESTQRDADIDKIFKGKFNILFTGNISPAQDFPVMIEAAKRLKEQGLTNLQWVIVGDGMSKEEVQQEIRTKGLEDCFRFEGHQPMEKIPFYNASADVLIACLVKSELLGLTIPAKIFSYIAAGKPIVTAIDGETQKLIRDAGCGFVSESSEATALAENIRKVYDMSGQERLKLGENAREYHLKYLQRDQNLQKLIHFMFY